MSEDQTHEAQAGQITPNEMATAIESSGYLLEARIAHILRKRGFFIQPNLFQTDPCDPSKVIEADVAGRYFEAVNPEETHDSFVYANVLVECKNNAQPLAFFVQSQQITEINAERIICAGYPDFSMDTQTQTEVGMRTVLNMMKWHHYCREDEEVATQFCTFERTGKKWKAGPNKNYADSFSKIALMAQLEVSEFHKPDTLPQESIQFSLSYPIVVFQGPIFRVREHNGKATLEESRHIQLHHHAIGSDKLTPVQIDLVTEQEFPILMETILKELRTCRDRIKAMYTQLSADAANQRLRERTDNQPFPVRFPELPSWASWVPR